MNVAKILQEQARARPNAPALIESRGRRGRAITFSDLDRKAAQAASLLQQAGLHVGDTVLVFQPMSAELYIALAAIFRLGLLAMFVDPSADREQLERSCAICPPRALIASSRAHLLRLRSAGLRAIPIKFVIGPRMPGAIPWQRASRLRPHAHILPCDSQQPALLTFTSGTLDEPKAAVRTHGFLVSQHRVLDETLRLKAGDTDLTTLPIVLLANLASGVTSLVPDANLSAPGSINPKPVVAQIKRHGVVSAAASPAFFEQLVRYCAQQRLILPGLKKLFTGGAPVFPRLLRQLMLVAPHAEVVAVYGSTEAEPIAHVATHQIGPADYEQMRGGQGLLAGRPVEGICVRIFPDHRGRPVGPLTDGEFDGRCFVVGRPGEIVVSGEHVLTGYLNGQGDQETKFRVGSAIWHRTGDAGYFDSQGRLWLLGRCSARVDDRHGALYPFAVEAAIYDDSRVRRAAFVPHKGRRVLALEFFETKASADCTQVEKQLGWARIDEVRVCHKIPIDRRHNAKVDYPALYRMLDNAR